jgi:dimethylamine corrinoid protein
MQGEDTVNLSDIVEAIAELEDEQALALVNEALAEGMDPVDILQNGIVAGLREIGRRFDAEEYYLAELMMGGKLSQECIALVEPHMPEGSGAKSGVVVLGAVQGDLHDIGYKLVSTQLKLAGYEVHEIGVNVAPMTFVQKAQELKADIIGLSAFLITTLPLCGEVVNYLRDMGIRDNHRVIIGGAEASHGASDSMGCDGYAPNAVQSVVLCDRLMDRVATV